MIKKQDNELDYDNSIHYSKESNNHRSSYARLTTNDNSTTNSISSNTIETVEDNSITIQQIDKPNQAFEIAQSSSSSGTNEQYKYKRLGKSYAFMTDKHGDPIFIIGPQWPMYFCLVTMVSCGIFFYLYFFWEFTAIGVRIAGLGTYCSFMFFYTYTAIINPGYPKNNEGRRLGMPRDEYRFCSVCKFWVMISRKSNHCLDCGICVEGYDHHCPWTSKCIGNGNKISFYGFIGSILLIFGFFISGILTAPVS